MNTRILQTLWLGCACLASSGCLSEQFVRFPSLTAAHPAIQRAEFQQHDPFADDAAGPATGTRPPSYGTQRAEVRRSRENSLKPHPGGMPFSGSSSPPASMDYPQSVVP